MSRIVRPATLGFVALFTACSSSGTSGGGTPTVASVAVTPSTATVTAGSTTQLTATPDDASGAAVTGQSVTWASSNAAIASVSASGLVTGVVAGGPVTISATAAGVSGTASVTVTPPPVASVNVTPTTATIMVGATGPLVATLRDSHGNQLTGRTVTWSSSDATIASVNSSGIVTGVAVGGPVTITATSEGISGTASVTVSPVPVASVQVLPGTGGVYVGTTFQLTATMRDANGNMLTGRMATWASSDPTVATVTTSGLVTGVAVGGPVTITATSEGINGTATITVSVAPVASVSVSPTPTNVVIGTTTQLAATLKDANNNILTGRVVTWSSSNTALATVSSSGLVTGVAVGGPVTITATSEGINGTASVTVNPVPVASVTVMPTPASVGIAGSIQLTITTKDAQGNVLVGRMVTWQTSDPTIATVSATGVVTGVSLGGPITITATSEGIIGTASVTVVMQTIYWTVFNSQPATPQIQSASLPLMSGSPLTNVPWSTTLRGTAGMAFDATGRLWVISYPQGGGIIAAVFVPPVTPASTPALQFSLPPTGDIDYLTFDHLGNLWASDYYNKLEYMFVPPFTASRTLVPSVTLALPGFSHPTGIAVDAAGNVYVPNLGSTGTNSIAVFTTPVTSASVPAFYLNGLTGPGTVRFDSHGNLYASTGSASNQTGIARYNSTNLMSGAMPDILDQTGLGTQNYGAAFAFDVAGNLFVADCGNAGTAGIRSYPVATNPFSSTLAPSATYSNTTIASVGCVWGIAIH